MDATTRKSPRRFSLFGRRRSTSNLTGQTSTTSLPLSDASEPPAKRSYTPRYAGRDALLCMPAQARTAMARERQRKDVCAETGFNSTASSFLDKTPVHPNGLLSLRRNRSCIGLGETTPSASSLSSITDQSPPTPKHGEDLWLAPPFQVFGQGDVHDTPPAFEGEVYFADVGLQKRTLKDIRRQLEAEELYGRLSLDGVRTHSVDSTLSPDKAYGDRQRGRLYFGHGQPIPDIGRRNGAGNGKGKAPYVPSVGHYINPDTAATRQKSAMKRSSPGMALSSTPEESNCEEADASDEAKDDRRDSRASTAFLMATKTVDKFTLAGKPEEVQQQQHWPDCNTTLERPSTGRRSVTFNL